MWLKRRLCNCGGKLKIRDLTESFKLIIVCLGFIFIFFLHMFLLLFNDKHWEHFPKKFEAPCNFNELLFQKSYIIHGKNINDLFNLIKSYDPIPTNFDQIFTQNFACPNNSTNKFLSQMKTVCLESRIKNILQNYQNIPSKYIINIYPAFSIILLFHLFIHFYTKDIKDKDFYCDHLILLIMCLNSIYGLYILFYTEKFLLLILVLLFVTFVLIEATFFLFLSKQPLTLINVTIFSGSFIHSERLVFSLFLFIQILFYESGMCLLNRDFFNYPDSFYENFCKS